MRATDGVSEDGLPVRDEIVVSWFRSAHSGVRSDRLHVPYDPAVDGENRLAWAAGPVLHVLARHAPDHGLRTWLDHIQLAPGFRYGEDEAGTNAIGTALAVRRPFVVEGGEHFADIFGTMTCAAVPISDPRTGDLLGAVDLSCRAEHASPLMLPVAKRAAWE